MLNIYNGRNYPWKYILVSIAIILIVIGFVYWIVSKNNTVENLAVSGKIMKANPNYLIVKNNIILFQKRIMSILC